MISSSGFLFAAFSTWMTPVWILAVGATLGLAILLVVYGAIWIVRRDFAEQIPDMMREGSLQPVLYLLLFLALFSLIASVQMPAKRIFASAKRVLSVGPMSVEVEIPAGAEKHEIPIRFRSEEIVSYEIESDQDILLYVDPEENASPVVIVQAGETARWVKVGGAEVPLMGDIVALYASNESSAPGALRIHIVTDVAYPQVYSIPITAFSVLALFAIFFAIRLGLPKVAAIAGTTAKQGVNHPVFLLSMSLGAFLLLVFIYVPYNTFGEDVKMLKDSGLTLIMVLSILVALWTASVSVWEELEGRTALTLLSKPVSRRQFVIGKFLGILWPILLLFIFLGFLFLITISYKVVYDARETSNPNPEWQQCYVEMIRIVPGLALALMEAIVLASISLAISTRLPMLANLTICGSIYVLGHLVPMIVESSLADKFEIVSFVGLLIATVFPVLDHFNIQAAVAAGVFVPLVYLGWALVYCALYSSIMMLLALALFEDRDLA